MFKYDQVKELSDVMLSDLASLRSRVEFLKDKTETFKEILGDTIADSALTLVEDISSTINQTELIIRDRTTKTGEFAEAISTTEKIIRGKVSRQ